MKLYKHDNNTDVAAEFIRVMKFHDYYKVKLSWWNIVNYEKPFPLLITETVKILKDDWRKWKILDL